jgi:hypothetical protein
MARKLILLATVTLVAAMFSESSLCQMQRTGSRSRSEEVHRRHLEWATRRREQSRQMREQAMKEAMKQSRQQAREQSLREALKVKDAQWPVVRPKLMKVVALRDEAKVAVTIKEAREVTTTETVRGDRSSSGRPETTTTHSYEDWSYSRSWELETKLTRGQKVCDELVALLETGTATDEQKIEKMNALRKAREDAAEELVLAQEELRKVLSLRQEATLIMMGLLN